jgi:hypothetical protein
MALVSRVAAARALDISTRQLDRMARTGLAVAVLRIGRRVLLQPEVIAALVARQSAEQQGQPATTAQTGL